MADIRTPEPAEVEAWNTWVAMRPPAVRAIAERFFPWKLYRLGTSGRRGLIVAFDESAAGVVTVRVAITGQYNRVAFERMVFGIAPEEIIECDLPGPEERLGSLNLDARVFLNMGLTEDEVLALHDEQLGGVIVGCMAGEEPREA